jgi:hypothetical protein
MDLLIAVVFLIACGVTVFVRRRRDRSRQERL